MQEKEATSRWNNRPVTKSRTIVSEGGASGKVATFSSGNNSRATSGWNRWTALKEIQGTRHGL